MQIHRAVVHKLVVGRILQAAGHRMVEDCMPVVVGTQGANHGSWVGQREKGFVNTPEVGPGWDVNKLVEGFRTADCCLPGKAVSLALLDWSLDTEPNAVGYC